MGVEQEMLFKDKTVTVDLERNVILYLFFLQSFETKENDKMPKYPHIQNFINTVCAILYFVPLLCTVEHYTDINNLTQLHRTVFGVL